MRLTSAWAAMATAWVCYRATGVSGAMSVLDCRFVSLSPRKLLDYDNGYTVYADSVKMSWLAALARVIVQQCYRSDERVS